MDRKELSVLIGSRIKYHRIMKHLSQEQAAFDSEMHPSYYGCIERGEKCPTIDTLFRISKALGVSVTELLDFDGITDGKESDHVRDALEYRANAAGRNIPMKDLPGAVMMIEMLSHMLSGKNTADRDKEQNK